MAYPNPVPKYSIEPNTAYGAEDDFHDGKALLARALDTILSQDAGFPEEIVRRGRTYGRADIEVRRDRIVEDLAYIQDYLRQCSKRIDWPEGRLLG